MLLYLIGFRHWSYRKRAVAALGLQKGDRVVDLGCGTGLNFSLLQEQIGLRGKILGVYLTDAMLAEAEHRVLAQGWLNVALVKSDAALYVFPASLAGIISAFALTLVPAFDEVVQRGSDSLRPGKRFVILDFKMPSGRLIRKAAPALAKLMTGPFGGTLGWQRASLESRSRDTLRPRSFATYSMAALISPPAKRANGNLS